MENIIILPESSKQSSIIKAFLKEMKISFKTKKDDTRMTKEEFYRKIEESSRQAKEGKVRRLTPELQKEIFGKEKSTKKK